MANHTINDFGRDCLAVGAPGSLMRIKEEYPRLISELAGKISAHKEITGIALDNLFLAVKAEL